MAFLLRNYESLKIFEDRNWRYNHGLFRLTFKSLSKWPTDAVENSDKYYKAAIAGISPLIKGRHCVDPSTLASEQEDNRIQEPTRQMDI